MTGRERIRRTLACEPIGGRVPHWELEYYLTMEKLGRVHPMHRKYSQWNQMSLTERRLHIEDMADVYISFARLFEHSAIHVNVTPWSLENLQLILERIREKTGDEFFLAVYSDPTWAIPDGKSMMDFSVQMIEEPEALNEISRRRVEQEVNKAAFLDKNGHIADGFLMGSDYCFNANHFFSPDQFEELIVPYLKEVIAEFHKLGFYAIKHTDGNVIPILRQIADCGPDAIHSLDPQGGVSLSEARRIVGENICLMGNVNCGLLQTGTDEECDADVMRALREGMANGRGYIFSTSNCVYTGLPPERYDRMWRLWKQYGIYGTQPESSHGEVHGF